MRNTPPAPRYRADCGKCWSWATLQVGSPAGPDLGIPLHDKDLEGRAGQAQKSQGGSLEPCACRPRG